MNEKWNTTHTNGELLTINDKLDQYRGEFGVYKPKFKGRYENEYPNRWYDHIIQILMILPLYVVLGLTLWGFVVWGLADPLSYGWTNVGVFAFFLIVIFLLVFIYGANRSKLEREFIAKKYAENTEKKRAKQAESEQNTMLLREYRKAMSQRIEVPVSHSKNS